MLNTAVLLFCSLPLVFYLENDETVVEVGVEVVDPGFHAQAVHPVPVHLERTISQDKLEIGAKQLKSKTKVE